MMMIIIISCTKRYSPPSIPPLILASPQGVIYSMVIMTIMIMMIMIITVVSYGLPLQANVMVIPPPVGVRLLNDPIVDNYDISSVRKVLSGAAAISGIVQAGITKRLKLDSFRQGMPLMAESAASHSGRVCVYLFLLSPSWYDLKVRFHLCGMWNENGRYLCCSQFVTQHERSWLTLWHSYSHWSVHG